MLPLDKIIHLKYDTSMARCKGCTNRCVLTVNRFEGGRQFISGNRCERGLGREKVKKEVPNLFDYKYRRIFDYEALPPDMARRGTIGIPLCLNMWELLPFWHTFFTHLGFAVYHSPLSSRDLYLKGQATIPSDTACFPAKLAHGHIQFLSRLGLDAIFTPA